MHCLDDLNVHFVDTNYISIHSFLISATEQRLKDIQQNKRIQIRVGKMIKSYIV